MEREAVVRILLFCRTIDKEISINKCILQDYENRYYGALLSAPYYSVKKNKYREAKPTELTAISVPDSASVVMRELLEQNEILCKAKAVIQEELNNLPALQKSILHDFYFCGHQWVQVSERNHYCESQCKKIRNRALDCLAKPLSSNGFIKNYIIERVFINRSEKRGALESIPHPMNNGF